ncbi:MAG: indole-3-glycerol phosphate synthase TrpC [Rhodothermia bacterium]|nr:MAG: indole-3-glycerol phosphate synthase TrpC [Rhodothermia bacterium]
MADSILDQIVVSVRERLSVNRKKIRESDLKDHPLFHRETLSLADAIRQDRLAIIAEVKKASPSQGVIRDDFDPEELSSIYAEAGAEAISVLTEPDFFQGHLEHLEAARQTVGIPLLRKDFIIDPYQIIEAKAHGADAVLLIATLLSRSHLDELWSAADECGLESLVELYEERELDRVEMDRVRILGVNNRDLRTFEIETDRASRILSRVPDHIVRVAESGFKTSEDLHRVSQTGIDAVLIGEIFMRAENPGECLCELRNGAYSDSNEHD